MPHVPQDDDSSTKSRILSAAEALFAEAGFSGTSLRQLTQLADVNLAAVNYHFGSKDNLIKEVLRRRLDGLSRDRLKRFEALIAEHGDQPPLRPVLRAFIFPAMAISNESGEGSPFVKVLARAFVEYRDEFRLFLSERYGDVNKRYFRAIAAHLGHLDANQIFARIDFMIGALTYAMAEFGVSVRPDDHHRDWRQRAENLLDFVEAGLRAPSAKEIQR